MPDGTWTAPQPKNEPVLTYEPGSIERGALKTTLKELSSHEIEIPLYIGGREIRTGRTAEIRAPHDHELVLGRYHQAGENEVLLAIEAAKAARHEWEALDWRERAAVFLRAAQLLAGPWRATLNAATMLGQSKTVHQAEIDSACELIDFWRFNPRFAGEIYAQQPPISPTGRWNRLDYRPLDGFVFAVTPFNFTSIAGNLPTSPALMGNTVVWKPASNAVYSAWQIVQLLEEAGLPPGVVNFVPGPGHVVGESALTSPDFAGLHFTGSTATLQSMWRAIGHNIERYRAFPRIVGETGGKGFVFAHPSADPDALVTALVRGAYEFQGQKCSAASRAYLPESLWPAVRDRLRELLAGLQVGDVADFRNFLGAVIDEQAFRKITGYIDEAKGSPDYELVFEGKRDSSEGWFIGPTVVRTTHPKSRLMQEEIFGPVLTVFVYPDDSLDEALSLCNSTSPFALTGAVFARDRRSIAHICQVLRGAAGNFYVNDKPTGAIVGQQPFGGSRLSGTNDKSGSAANLMRWVSIRSIAETFVPPTSYGYSFMMDE
ncbi:MAG: L-glutamate gamma-semialdehyde dehydrogenase [Myxococcales bacterium]|jgi:1-pyrroline-5-carboxylate dehydrogenase